MKLLLDNNLDVGFSLHLHGFDVETVRDRGWRSLSNGDLLRSAQRDFDVLITADKNMP